MAEEPDRMEEVGIYLFNSACNYMHVFTDFNVQSCQWNAKLILCDARLQ